MAKNKQAASPDKDDQNVVTTVQKSATEDKNVVNIVWNFLSSMKLGITLLLVLAVLAAIPTFIKNPSGDFAQYYNAWWFRLVLGLLGINLLICSINRWRAIKSTLRGPNPNFSESFVNNLKVKQRVVVKTGADGAANKVSGLLKHKGYRVFTEKEGDTFKFSSDKGHLGILGPYITHLSFIVLIIGIVIKFSGAVGFDGYVAGNVNQTVNLTDGQNIQNLSPDEEGIQLKIDNFRTEYRPNKVDIKQWYSDVNIIDHGKAMPVEEISVNHPLVYKGIKFYQMSYDHIFSGTSSGPQAKNVTFSVQKQQQGYVQPAGSNVAFVPTGYNNYDVNNPKIMTDIYNGGQMVLRSQEISPNIPFKYGDAEITFTNVESTTVLSAKKDPGLIYMMIGSMLLLLGVILSFLLRQRRIWAVVTPEKSDAAIQIGGISAKDKRGLEEDIAQIVDKLK